MWGCALSLARSLTPIAHVGPPMTLSDGDTMGTVCDLGQFDHVVEIGSGLGALGLAIHRHLILLHTNVGREDYRHDNSPPLPPKRTKVTLTDYVPELLGALRQSAREAAAAIDDGQGRRSTSAPLSVERLEWHSAADNDGGEDLAWICPGESLLIVGSEVIYEPLQAEALSGCIRRMLTKSGVWLTSRVILANGADRSGWLEFIRRMSRMKVGGDGDGLAVQCATSSPFGRCDHDANGPDVGEDAMLLDIEFVKAGPGHSGALHMAEG